MNEVVTTGTFDLSTGKLFIASQMLLTMRTLKFEFAHALVICSLLRFVEQVGLFVPNPRLDSGQ